MLNSWHVVGAWLYLLNDSLANNFLFAPPLSPPQGQSPALSLTPSLLSIPRALTQALALFPGPLSQPPTRPPDLQSPLPVHPQGPRADLSAGPWTRSQPLSPAVLSCLTAVYQSPVSWLCLCWSLWSLLSNGITSPLVVRTTLSVINSFRKPFLSLLPTPGLLHVPLTA